MPPSFICPRCFAESFHPRDIAERYCGRCHVFVDDLAPAGLQADTPLPGDEGMRFFATVTTPDGETRHRETADRLALLAWVEAHATPADALVVQTEATGPAARAMLTAMKAGAASLLKRRARELF